MKRKPTKKEIDRTKRWSHRIGVKEKQVKYIDKEKIRLGFKSRNGTLDYIINTYKKNENA